MRRYKVETSQGVRTVDGLDALCALISAAIVGSEDQVRSLPDGRWYRAADHPDLAAWFARAMGPGSSPSGPGAGPARPSTTPGVRPFGEREVTHRVHTGDTIDALQHADVTQISGRDGSQRRHTEQMPEVETLARIDVAPNMGRSTEPMHGLAEAIRQSEDERIVIGAQDVDSTDTTAPFDQPDFVKKKDPLADVLGNADGDWRNDIQRRMEVHEFHSGQTMPMDMPGFSRDELAVPGPELISLDSGAPPPGSGPGSGRKQQVSGDVAVAEIAPTDPTSSISRADVEDAPSSRQKATKGRGLWIALVALVLVGGLGAAGWLWAWPWWQAQQVEKTASATATSEETDDDGPSDGGPEPDSDLDGASSDGDGDGGGDDGDGGGSDGSDGSDRGQNAALAGLPASNERDPAGGDAVETDSDAPLPLTTALGVEAVPPPDALHTCADGSTSDTVDFNDGTVLERCLTPAGRPSGDALTLSENGALIGHSEYRDGLLHGVDRAWTPDGVQVRVTPYHEGRLHGAAARWDEDGHLIEIGRWVGNLRHGRHVIAREDVDGELHAVGRCLEFGRQMWVAHERFDAWPESVVSPGAFPELYAQPCAEEGPEFGKPPQDPADTFEPLLRIPTTAFRQEDAAWVYRVSVQGLPGRIDESPPATYFMRRELVSAELVDEAADITLVKVFETGGPFDKRERNQEFRLEAGCYAPVDMSVGEDWPSCPAADDLQRPLPIGESTFMAQEARPTLPDEAPDIGRILVHPELGIVAQHTRDRRGRHVHYELVGYSVGGLEGSLHDRDPRACDWDRNRRPGGENDLEFDLTGAHGWSRVTARTVGWSSTVTLYPGEGNDAEPLVFEHTEKLNRIKSWMPDDEHAEYVVVQQEDVDEFVIQVHTIADGAVTSREFRWPMPDSGRIASLLGSDLDTCVLQLRHRIDGGDTRVERLLPTRWGLLRDGGTLGLGSYTPLATPGSEPDAETAEP